jgi:hypothetical protein
MRVATLGILALIAVPLLYNAALLCKASIQSGVEAGAAHCETSTQSWSYTPPRTKWPRQTGLTVIVDVVATFEGGPPRPGAGFAPFHTRWQRLVNATETNIQDGPNLTLSSSDRMHATAVIAEAMQAQHQDPDLIDAVTYGSSRRLICWPGVACNAALSLACLAAFVVLAAVWRTFFMTRAQRSALRQHYNLCVQCRYSLSNLPPNSPCPECGHKQGT